MKCEVCRTERRAQRACCKIEFARLRSRIGRQQELLDRMVAERDRIAAGTAASSRRVETLVDPWEDPCP